jgi:hypothetical protein
LSRWALGFWVFAETGSTTQLAIVIMAARLPALLVSPFAGALVDRWSRRTAMILSDAGAALGTLAIAMLVATNSLEIGICTSRLAYQALSEHSSFLPTRQLQPCWSQRSTTVVRPDSYNSPEAPELSSARSLALPFWSRPVSPPYSLRI